MIGPLFLFVALCAPLGLPFSQARRASDFHGAVGSRVGTQERIFNGTDQPIPGKLPWMAAVSVWQDVAGTNTMVKLCGGSLLNNDTVLTAAQCLTSVVFVSEVLVYIGIGDVDAAIAGANFVYVKEIFIHPNYYQNTHEFDFAIVKLTNSFLENDTLKYVGMPYPAMLKPDYFAGNNTFIYGWGSKTAGEVHSPTLQWGMLRVMKKKACNESMVASLWQLYDSQICAETFNAQQGFCDMDEGGPVTIMMPSFDRPVQIGVLTWYRSCSTKVPNIIAWLGAKDVLKWIASKGGPAVRK